MTHRTFTALGLMSGSSLDGLDLALCRFELNPTRPEQPVMDWQLLRGDTLPYPAALRERLRVAPDLSGRELWRLHTDLGRYFGEACRAFLAADTADLISSHGHTVFHFPAEGFTTQIGDGAAVAAIAGCTVVDQLRSMDVALGGQGAPLAPLADRYLFGEYEACLNLGGIANLSVRTPRGYVAFDVGGANQILDALAREAGRDYDAGGELARTGRELPELRRQADALPFFREPYPKSLGNDWVQEQLWPLFREFPASPADRLHTACRQLADRIATDWQTVRDREGVPAGPARLLATGGGAFNTFLIECIGEACGPDVQVVVPAAEIINLKEAVLIALCGALRLLGLPNSFASVTGARGDGVNGAVYAGVRSEE